MEWVCEEGHCDADDAGLGLARRSALRLAPRRGGPGRAGGGEGGDHRADEQPHQGRAVRRGAAPPAAARPGDDAGRAGRRRAPARPRLLGRRRRAHVPGPVRARRTAWPLPTLGPPPAVGEHAPRPADAARRHAAAAEPATGAPARSTGSRWSTSRGSSPARWPPGCSPTSAPPSSRSRGPATPTRRAAAAARCSGDLGLEGSVAVRPLQRRQARPQPRPDERDGPRRAARPRALGRRARRVVHARRDGRLGPRLRGAAGSQPAPGHAEHEPDGPDRAAVDVRRVRQPGRGDHRLLRADRLARPGPGRPVPRLHRLRRPEVHASPPCSPPSTGGAAPAAGSTSTCPRPRRRSTSSPRPSSTTPSTAPTRRGWATPTRSSTPTACSAAPATTSGWRSPARTTTSGPRSPASIGGARRRRHRGVDGATRKSADVEQALQAVGVPVHGVQNSAACWTDPQLVHRDHYLHRRPPRARHVHRRGAAGARCRARRASCAAPARRWASTTTSCCASSSATTTTASPTSSSPAPSADPAPADRGQPHSADRGRGPGRRGVRSGDGRRR